MKRRKAQSVAVARPPGAGVGHFLDLAFRVLLIMAVVVCALVAGWHAVLQKEFAHSADRFGYLQMAADMRRGSAPHGLPRFTYDAPRAREMLAFLSAQGVPLDNMAAASPSAYHYSAATDRFICQYPPGTGAMLSLFPEGAGVQTWRWISIMVLAALGLAAVMLPRGDALVRTVAVVAVTSGLCGIARPVSFSVHLLIAPLTLMVIGALASRRLGRWSLGLLAIAGLALGWGVVVRLSAGTFLPGLLVAAAWPEPGKEGGRVTLGARAARLAVALGAFAVGVVPLLLHQQALTGSWRQSTYTPVDASAPTFGVIRDNLEYYLLGDGNDLILFLVVGLACGGVSVLTTGRAVQVRPARSGLIVAACWLGVPTAYFLTHRVVTQYYQLSTILVALLGLAWALREKGAGPVVSWRRITRGTMAAVAGAFLLFQLIVLPWPSPELERIYLKPLTTPPAELNDPAAWILADRFSGTLWYYNGLPSIRVPTLEAADRTAFYAFLRAQGQKVYILEDGPPMTAVMRELQAQGARFAEVGKYGQLAGDDKSIFTGVYRVEW